MVGHALARRGLSLVGDVRADEAAKTLLMAVNGFLLLMAYSCIKPVREALILAHAGGAEYRAYAAGATALLLLVAVPAYSRVSGQLPRNRLVVSTTLFFASHLLAFYLLSSALGTTLSFALLFYLWIAVFNMMIVAQFWGFATDLYTEEAGLRLFPVLGFGVSLGAVTGAAVARALITRLGTMAMLPVAAGVLISTAAIAHWVHVREVRRAPSSAARAVAMAAIGGRAGDAFRAVLQDRYLLYIAGFSLLFTLVKTNGDYMLARAVVDAATRAVAAGTLPAHQVQNHIGEVFASITFWVDVISLVLQGLVVSRIVRYLGFAVAFYVLPLLALGDAALMTLWPVLIAIRIGKTAESATDYSLNNTVRNMLWLSTSRRAKYLAKQATDTLFVRAGDVLSAGLIFLAAQFGLPPRSIAVSNVVLAAAWLFLARAILRERNERLARAIAATAQPEPL